MALTIRRARDADAREAAELWLRARRAAAIPATVHTDDDVRDWLAAHLLPHCEVWLAEDASGLVGLLALDGDWVDQLYVAPEATGRGIGTSLLELAKRERPAGLRLWTFVSNEGAQRFYERHGFAEVERTDGRRNEERAPDILYRWPATAAGP